MWTFDAAKSRVHQLSHFGDSRNGVGVGAFNSQSNLTIEVHFQDDPEGIYRVYEYKWISKDEYQMVSKQYDKNQEHTGNWYGGTFIRIGDGLGGEV